jgi:hypothetical protein
VLLALDLGLRAGVALVPAANQIRTYSWWRPPRIGLGRLQPTA